MIKSTKRNVFRIPEQAIPLTIESAKILKSEMKSLGLKKSASCFWHPTTSGLWVAAKYRNGDFQSLISLEGPNLSSSNAGLALRIPSILPKNYDVRALFGINSDKNVVLILGQINLPSKYKEVVKQGLPKIKKLKQLGSYFLSLDPPNLKLAACLRFTAVDSLMLNEEELIRADVSPKYTESHLTSAGFQTYNTHFGELANAMTRQELTKTDPTPWLEKFGKLNSEYKISGLRPIPWRTQDGVFKNIIYIPG